MTAIAAQHHSHAPANATPPARRFERVAVSSIFGDPMDRRTWSAAPYNVASCLQKLGIAVEGIHSGGTRGERGLLALYYMMTGYGRPHSSEAVLRLASARRKAAERLAETARRRRIRHILHMGTLDLPPVDRDDGVKHYLYCDQTWALSLAHRPDISAYSRRAVANFEVTERAALDSVEHVFTFGHYVRDHMIAHYCLPPEKVTAVGSGMGQIEPYDQPKDYSRPHLLFVAKHLFAAKGGNLLVEAFRIAQRQRPDLLLNIVGDPASASHVATTHPGIHFHPHLPWRELQRLYRVSTILVQPMLNDPWGQVYLEALLSRTPVVGLHRNGLPEIVENGQHGFLVETADPQALAATILDALSDPQRLAEMGWSGQQHVLQSYSWDAVANRIAFG
ncbi:MAG: glycosyltransferase family 4 protein [Ferrovibrio sp.]